MLRFAAGFDNPRTMSSQLFYRRKLATYNLTVFELGTKKGNCYMWREGVGKRGSTNIASCIWKHLTDIPNQTVRGRNLFFFSDNCTGQNKNKVIAALYLHAVRTLNVQNICHYYFEHGHTQNEGDSVHALIERSANRMTVNVYDPSRAHGEEKGEPYRVTEMKGQMLDFIQ